MFQKCKKILDTSSLFYKEITPISLWKVLFLVVIFSLIAKTIGGMFAPMITILIPIKEINKFIIEPLFLYSGTFLFLLWRLRSYEKRAFTTLGISIKDIKLLRIVKGSFLGIFIIALSVIILSWQGSIQFASENIISSNTLIFPTLLFLGIWLFQGLGEEIVFRGWLLQNLAVKYSRITAIILSSVLFTALHCIGQELNIIFITNLLLASVVLALYAVREGNIWGAAAFHGAWNWAQGSFFGFNVSGTPVKDSLIPITGEGAKYLTGGKFGLEASIIITLLLLFTLIYLITKNNKK